MRRFLPEHTVRIFGYAAKHDYDNVAEEAVLHTVRLPLVQVFDQIHLPTRFFRPWIKYRETWITPFGDAFQQLLLLGTTPHLVGARVMMPPCQSCGITLFTMVMELQTLRSLDELNQALAKPSRERARSGCVFLICGYPTVVKQITTDIKIGIKNIPAFETFLRGD